MKEINLQGLRLLNTRPALQGEGLTRVIQKAHGSVISCPAMEITPHEKNWLSRLPTLDTVSQAIFISPNAVRYSFNVFSDNKIVWPTKTEVIAVGKGTALALEHEGVSVNHIPSTADSEHLLMLDCLQPVAHQTILLFKGSRGRTLITDALIKRGANLIELEVYQRILPQFNKEQLDEWWRDDAVDIILYTSQEAIENIFTMFGAKAHFWLKTKPCLVISSRLAEAATQLGVQQVIICSMDTIIDTLHQFNKGLIHGKKR